MKILWLYKYLASYDFDNWLHLKFVEVLKQHPGVEVLVYGPDIATGYPHLTTLPFNNNITAEDIQKHFDFDVIIMNTKSRMFMDYNPHKNTSSGEWIPKKLSLVKKPRIVIEEDYHYERDDDWYWQNRVDLILQRHWSQSLRQKVVPMQWFPFSVDTGTFFPESYRRDNRICFAGSTNDDAYRYRFRATNILKQANMIDVFAAKQKLGCAYVDCLRSWVSHLCCSSTYLLTPAKIFEIMASGSALFTNENDDLSLLFPKNSYYTYNKDCSNVLKVAKEILHDPVRRVATVNTALTAIKQKHTHQVRIDELL